MTTASRAALDGYQEGVAALVAGRCHAEDLLAEAVTADPDFLLARAALAIARAIIGAPVDLPAATLGLSRGERQHLEVLRATLTGDPTVAADLRREHLAEFPGDLLVVWLGDVPITTSSSPAARPVGAG